MFDILKNNCVSNLVVNGGGIGILPFFFLAKQKHPTTSATRESLDFDLVVVFYGISTFSSYLMSSVVIFFGENLFL